MREENVRRIQAAHKPERAKRNLIRNIKMCGCLREETNVITVQRTKKSFWSKAYLREIKFSQDNVLNYTKSTELHTKAMER